MKQHRRTNLVAEKAGAFWHKIISNGDFLRKVRKSVNGSRELHYIHGAVSATVMLKYATFCTFVSPTSFGITWQVHT